MGNRQLEPVYDLEGNMRRNLMKNRSGQEEQMT